ncbi:hypothetical protein [Jeotgalibacillus marinus]|uniref:Uncharacterized protein n=1 Tax=Jeotgalibacillus marinus TaxID=86667 RepID=A0ABV3Q6U6_9BACL
MGGSYFILRLANINNLIVIILTLSMMILGPLIIYLLLIRPKSMPKLLTYGSFILCLGASYLIIPSSQKGFFNQILVLLLPVVEVSIIIFVVYSIVKSIIRYKRSNTNKRHDFLEVARISLEPKLGKGFVLEAVLTELSVYYYSVLVWFKKPFVEVQGTYSYHKTSQIKTFVILLLILLVVEGALFHYLIQKWSDIFAWIFTILTIYALFYILGLYNSVKYLPHASTKDKLTIRLGYQSSIEVNINNIETINKAKERELGVKIPKGTYLSLLWIDSPQYELSLKEPALMKGTYG